MRRNSIYAEAVAGSVRPRTERLRTAAVRNADIAVERDDPAVLESTKRSGAQTRKAPAGHCIGVMKTHHEQVEELLHRRCEADLEATLKLLFGRCPTLCGFMIASAPDCAQGGPAGQHASGLFVTGVSVYPVTGVDAPEALYAEIAATLVRLVNESPFTSALLRERTFARVFH